jgi:hypothetical protein
MTIFCACGRKAIYGRFDRKGKFRRGTRRDHDWCWKCFRAFVDRRRAAKGAVQTPTRLLEATG